MPKKISNAVAANADQRLSQLIRLKRLEKPDADFWVGFEQEFRSRQLSTFVRIQPMHTRLARACLIIARKASPPVAAMGAVALTFIAVSSTSYLVKTTSDEPQIHNAEASPDLQTEDEGSYFVVQSEPTKDEAETQNSTGSTIYHTNILNPGYRSADTYQLNATPVTYSQGTQIQSIGAQVITNRSSY